MNLASPISREESRTLLGVLPFHLFTMVLLIAFALSIVAMYFFKMRRAAALLADFQGRVLSAMRYGFGGHLENVPK
jgi:hypothetical protein